MGVLFQIIGSFIVCSLTMSTGIIFAWPSSTSVLFASENTTLYRPMTSGEVSLLGSMSSAGPLVSTPLLAIFIDRIGRKNCSIICALMNVIGWTMIAATKYVEVVLAATFVIGLGGASFIVCVVFVVEFCQESIRGAMSSSCMVFYGVGMLFTYLVGGLLDYWNNVYVSLGVTILNLGLLGILKESPLFLLMKGREKEAAESIAFYRRINSNSKETLDELAYLRRTIGAAVENDTIPEEEQLKPVSTQEKFNLFQFIKKSRSTRRGIFLTLVLMTSAIFQGLVVVQVYAQPLFEQTIPEMSSTAASVLFAVINVVSGCIAAYLTEKAGRKPLIIYSSLVGGICCILCGLRLQLDFGPSWLTPIFIYLFAICYTFGGATVPFVLLSEVFVPEVKSYMSMLAIEWNWLCSFLILIIFDPLMKAIGLGSVFYLFATVCFFTAVFSVFFVPETKGVPLDEIQRLLVPKKHRSAA